MSIVITCDTQTEMDEYWELLNDANPATARSMMKAMLQMKKLDIAQLHAASERA